MNLTGMLAATLVIGGVLAWMASRAALVRGGAFGSASRARCIGMTLLSLFCSIVMLLVGAVPFYLAEIWTPPGAGAPFVFLAWIGFGPIISFLVIPGLYTLLTAYKARETYRRYGLPVVVGVPLLLAILVDLIVGKAAGGTQDTAIILVFIATVALTWLFYLMAMDNLGRAA